MIKKDGWGEDIFYHFSENEYVAVTGWPNMKQTISHDGWLGIAPVNKVITLRSLDFWRLEHGKIRENWVLVDLLDIYNQIGVNVFSRLKEFNKANTKGVFNEVTKMPSFHLDNKKALIVGSSSGLALVAQQPC